MSETIDLEPVPDDLRSVLLTNSLELKKMRFDIGDFNPETFGTRERLMWERHFTECKEILHLLSLYLGFKSVAEYLRGRKCFKGAQVYEGQCDWIFDRLPRSVKWTRTSKTRRRRNERINRH